MTRELLTILQHVADNVEENENRMKLILRAFKEQAEVNERLTKQIALLYDCVRALEATLK